MTEARDYYRVLQVDPDAEPEVSHAAYRRLAAKYHPDVNQSAEASDRMSEINTAYGVLKDPEQRAQYDRARGLAYASATRTARPTATVPHESSIQGFMRAIVLMVISGIILNLIFGAFAGGSGRFLAVGVIAVLLIWKGGPIFRYFSGKG
jgi:curved DNA-binding protein